VTAAARVLELRSVRGTGGGPEKTILAGAARSDPSRFRVTVCYLRDGRDRVFSIDRRAAQLGIDYQEIRERHSFDPSIWPALRKLVRQRQIDIVHAHEYKTNLLALLLARVEPVIPLTTVHGWSGSSLRERFYYAIDRRLLARYPLVITVSEAIRRVVIEHGARPDRVRRVSNGIDEQYFRRDPDARQRTRSRLGIDAASPVIGAVGRLEGEKRFDLLLRAAAAARGVGDVTLVIAGEGSRRADLEKLAGSLGIRSRVHLPGHWEDVRQLYPAFDVYVQSSDTEGIPNALLEAMAMEVPVVATRVGGTAELIDDGVHGLLAPRGDTEALTRAIECTLSAPAGAHDRIAAARTRIERELSFAARMRAVESVYDELLEARRGASGWA
jgi:glycosyltransferase involved in cell wall biosynthesis